MGRCYEFGVVITEGCDHTMTVPDEGGRCVCNSCGADCLGRFNGCASIISRPGYVPLLAPASAREHAPEPPAEAETPAAAVAAVPSAAPEPAVAEIVPIDEAQLERLLSAPGVLWSASTGSASRSRRETSNSARPSTASPTAC